MLKTHVLAAGLWALIVTDQISVQLLLHHRRHTPPSLDRDGADGSDDGDDTVAAPTVAGANEDDCDDELLRLMSVLAGWLAR